MADSVWDASAFVQDYYGALSRLDLEEFLGFWAEDAVFNAPYAPPGFPTEVVGRKSLGEFFGGLVQLFEVLDFYDFQVLPLAEGSKAVVTMSSTARLKDGRSYANDYVILLEVEDGKVTRSIEYYNPRGVLETFSSDPELVTRAFNSLS